MEAGYAPQLPLEVLIAIKGGFKGLAPSPVSGLLYWHLRGGDPVQEQKAPIEDIPQTVQDAEDGLKRLVRAFDDPRTPYLSNPRPEVAGYGDYDHLARVDEWRDRGESS